jgi:hypothetical protein
MPFSTDEFLTVFAAYNTAVWPMQWLLNGVAVAVIALAVSSAANRDRWISALLSLLWMWMAVAYHLAQFARINPAAHLFAIAFLLESALLLWFGWRTKPTAFGFRPDGHGWIGVGAIVYALGVYPALNVALGHRYPASPTFGVPCPTTIFTLGILCFARGRGTGVLLVIPALWAGVGGSAAFLLDIPQDYGLIVTALVALVTVPARLTPIRP